MEQHIKESERFLPVDGAYDVAVVGGGIAGAAAAIAAARNGAKTCLIEKAGALGGLATIGNVVHYLPLCDGKGNQVIAGLGEELLLASIRDGYAQLPAGWRQGGNEQERLKARYEVKFSPASMMLELEELTVKAGVELLYDTVFCDVVKQGSRIHALLVENKSGRLALVCKTVVDASGDADVCARAGEETESFRTNVAGGWFHYVKGKEVFLQPQTRHFTADPSKLTQGIRGYSGADGRDVTAQILESRQMIRDRLAELRQKSPGMVLYPLFIPTIATFRMTRRLKAAVELRMEDERKFFDDVIGMTGSWRTKGPIFYIPLRSLTAVRTENLITAGRCMSSAGECWDLMRAIPACAVTGEAAGTAAALAAQQAGGRLGEINVAALQAQLRKQSVIMDRRFAKG